LRGGQSCAELRGARTFFPSKPPTMISLPSSSAAVCQYRADGGLPRVSFVPHDICTRSKTGMSPSTPV